MGFKETAIGLIPEEWQVKTIDEIKAKQQYALAMGPFGSNITTNNFIPSGIPIIRGVNLSNYKFKNSDFVYVSEAKADELKSSNAFPDDIVVTHRGTLGQIGIIPENEKHSRYVVSQSQMKFTPNKNIANPEFVFYYLKSPAGQHQLLINTSTTGVPAIAQPLTSLRKILVPLPSPQEQTAIVKVLKLIDDKIELCHELNAELGVYGQLFFKHWFVDFEFPNQEGKPYKTTGGKIVYSKRLGKEIPAGWSVDLIGNVVRIVRGASPRPIQEFLQPEGMPWVKISDATSSSSKYLMKTSQYIKLEGIPKSRTVEPGTLILSNSASPGLPMIMNITACVHDGWLIFDDYQSITKEFLYYYLQKERNSIISLSNGSVFNNLKTEILKNYPIIVPPATIMEKITQLLRVVDKKILCNMKEIMLLESIRDGLLPKLMSGKVRVPLNRENLEAT